MLGQTDGPGPLDPSFKSTTDWAGRVHDDIVFFPWNVVDDGYGKVCGTEQQHRIFGNKI